MRIGWFAIYAVAGIVAVLFETGVLAAGSVTANRAVYIMQTVGVLASLAMIPLALGGFKKMMDRMEDESFGKRLKIYMICSWARIAAFFLVVVYGVLLYYLIDDNIGLYCAVIGAICSMFCFPTANALEYDVNWEDGEE